MVPSDYVRTKSGSEHILWFIYKCASLLHDKHVNLTFNIWITSPNLSNNEIKEHDRSNCDNQAPEEPVHSVLELIEHGRSAEIEVSQTDSVDRDHIRQELIYLQVLLAWERSQFEHVSDVVIVTEFILADVQNWKDDCEHEKQDTEEQHEHSEIEEYLLEHSN